MRHIKDMRGFLSALSDIGELQEIDLEVERDLEIGAIIRRAYDLKAPAPLFNNIKGVERGFRVLGGSAGVSAQKGLYLSRIAISLGFPPEAGAREIVNSLSDSMAKEGIPPRVLGTGVCQENVLTGDKIDLMKLQAPLLHMGDGGRYINTWGTVVVKTPDGKWTNWGIARVMLLDKNRMSGLIAPQQHLGVIHKMWSDRGEPTPFALALGCEPAVPFYSGTPFRENISEVEMLGAHFDEPIDTVRCKTVDLEVPATAEIVIEGTISHNETVIEGPMGEFAGYMGMSHPQPVFNVTAVTHRDDPILPVVVAGVPVEDTQTCCGVMYSAVLLEELRRQGFEASTCFLLFESAAHWLVVTVPRPCGSQESTEKLTHRAKEIIFGSKPGVDIPKVILLDDDIDPSDVSQVVWAYATRCHPEKDAHFYTHEKTLPLVHYLNAAEKKDLSSTKVICNGLLPEFDRHEISGFKYAWPEEVQEKVLGNWEKYGYRK